MKQGLEIHFVDNYLSIQVTTKKKAESQSFKFYFEPKKWYFLAITHEFHLLRKSEISLFVNGELVESKPLSYPKAGSV